MTAGRPELTLRAPAKLNLYLAVLGRRADGYHELVTVMQAIDLCDELTLRLRPRERSRERSRERRAGAPASDAPDVTLELARPAPGVPVDAENLAVRAAALVLEQAGAAAELGLDLRLDKRIPAGGGLGGGSSDAAAVLIGVNRLLGAPLDTAALEALAARLGSDTAFFLHGGTALCTGRGERVRPITPPQPFAVTLLLPPFATPTPAVYAALSARPWPASPSSPASTTSPASPTSPASSGAAHFGANSAELESLCASIANADAAALERLFRNDLEGPARRVDPRLAELLDRTHLHLSGSGSTLFGFGHLEAQLRDACQPTSICLARSFAASSGKH